MGWGLMDTIVYIRHEGHTVTEAINRGVMHYAYHTGQIVYIAQMLAEDGNPLSIVKGHSGEYNRQNFFQDKKIKHFTDDD